MAGLRVLVDSPGSASWNMAVDQVLLESAEKEGRSTLRFYGGRTDWWRWSRHKRTRLKHELLYAILSIRSIYRRQHQF